MNLSTQYYQSSQKFQFSTIVLFLIIGLLIGTLVGCVYAVLSSLSPMIILDMLLIIGLVLVLSQLTHKLTRLAKSRNYKVNMVVAFFISLSAYYASLITFEILVFDLPVYTWFELFIDPIFVVDVIFEDILPNRVITITGNSSRSGIGVSGIFLAIVYLIELIIFFLPVFFARKVDYFCEKCDIWYKKFIFFSFIDDKLLSNITTSQLGHYSDALAQVELYKSDKALTPLIAAETKQIEILNYHYCQCPNCRQNSILNLNKMMLKKEKKRFVLKKVNKGELLCDVYIDSRTDQLFTTLKDKFY